jgi:serine/threonine protein kinase
VSCGAKNDLADEFCFACKQPLNRGSNEPTERQFLRNRYRLLRKVGEGGFSAVYEALDLQSESHVAIKAVTLRGLSVQEKIDATDTCNREVSISRRFGIAPCLISTSISLILSAGM